MASKTSWSSTFRRSPAKEIEPTLRPWGIMQIDVAIAQDSAATSSHMRQILDSFGFLW